MKKEELLKNAIQFMADEYAKCTTFDMENAADQYANRIKSQMIESGFTESEAENARLTAKYSL